MIPRLLKANSLSFNAGTPLELTTQCNVVESLNGKYELNMEVLISDPNAIYIQPESIIMAKPNMTTQFQPFVVEEINKNIDGVLSIYATHIAQYRTKLMPVLPFNANSLSDAINKVNSISDNIFTLSSNKSVDTKYSLIEPRSYREFLGGKEGSLLDIYKGEYYFDRLNIQLLTRRGNANKLRIMYGSNMTTYNQIDSFDWSNSITGVLPYYKSDEENNTVVVVGDVQYSEYADRYSFKKTVVVDFSEKFEDKPSKAQLNEVAKEYIEGRGLPLVNIKASFEDITTLPNYRDILVNINSLTLGDSVQVINSLYNTNVSTRIREMDFDVLLERYNSITIGDATTTINESISGASGGGTTINNYYGGGSIDNIYPVGSIYMTVNDVNPSELFSGTEWQQIKDKFLLASGDTYTGGSTGGEATHTLSVSELPSHYHSINAQQVNSQSNGVTDGNKFVYGSGSTQGGWGIAGTTNNQGRSMLVVNAHNTNNQGSGTAHNNMPPYLAVYVWQRIA